MSLGTPAAVLLAILFLIPGFLCTKASQWVSPYVPSKIELLECLMLSCLNYLLGSPLIFALLVCWPADLDLRLPHTIVNHPVFLAWWLLLVFGCPVLLGLVSPALSRRMNRVLSRLGISILHPAPTGWDFAFARNERYWVRIELPDAEVIEGLFDANSLASGKPEERDIFLEQVFEWDEENQRYITVDRNAGLWVSADKIKAITFFHTDPDGAESRKALAIANRQGQDGEEAQDIEESNNG